MGLAHCTKCGESKTVREFYHDKHKGGPRSWCKTCCRKERADRITAGGCGSCSSPAVPGGVQCELHARRTAATAQRRYGTPRGRARVLLAGARKRARNEGVTCALTCEWFEARLAGVCEMTALPFDLTPSASGHFNPYAPSVDRKNGRDYTPENCRVVLTIMNWAMNTWGENTLRAVMDTWLHRNTEER